MPANIPFEEALRLCGEYREKHPARMLSQCWGCLRFSKDDPTKLCFHHPPDNRGCRFVNELFDRPR